MLGFLKKLFGGGDSEPTPSKVAQKTSTNVKENGNAKASSIEALHQLDCQKLNCPMPIVNISKKIRQMDINETLEITATDPAFKADLEAWVRKTNNELLSFEDGQIKKAIIKKSNNNI